MADEDVIKSLREMPQPPTYLHIENQQLKQQVAQLQGILQQRSFAILGQMIDALNIAAQGAAVGDEGARSLLNQWRDSLEKSAAAASGLTVVRR